MNSQLPDTQTLEDVVYSQDMKADIWGMLYSTKNRFKTLVMIKNEYSVGRNPICDVVLEKENSVSEHENNVPETVECFDKIRVAIPDNLLVTFSKLHFKIKKESSVVVLDDYSSNGTYVNGKLVGKGKKVILQSNDQISLAHQDYKVYVFVDNSDINKMDILNYPLAIKDNYVMSRNLGKGAYGEVFLVFQKRTFERYAMKVVCKKPLNPAQNSVMNEATILKSLNHPCVINVHNVIDSPEKVFIFLQYMEGGDLHSKVSSCKKLTESVSKWYFYQITKAVEYLHDQGIAHRDLKLENILLSSDKDNAIIKITDFGLSRFFNSQMVMQTVCGTPLYVAPEVLETKGCGAYTNKVDVWSMGVILYICLSGSKPFNEERKDMSLLEQIITGSYSFPISFWRGTSSNAVELVKKLMTVNPKNRIFVNKIASQPWFQDIELKRNLKAQNLFQNEGDENEPPCRRPRLGC